MSKHAETGLHTPNGNSHSIETGIGNGLEVRKADPSVPVILEDTWGCIRMIGGQCPFIHSIVTWESLEY